MEVMPQFPVYIPSKGRHDTRLTVKALEVLGVRYRIIVEQHQYADYASVIDPANILVLDPEYLRRYETLDDLGDSKSKGPGAARNFAWDHSIASGAEYHWVMDDNIVRFYRFHENQQIPVHSPAVLRCMEDFVLRYRNIAMAGPNYFMFAKRRDLIPPFILNTRIYSCNLIRNDVPFRWRGRYNEDTDLSLCMLKAGWCTVQFNAFLQGKKPTQTTKGGNTADFYEKEGTAPKSKMLVEAMHPDLARVTFRFGRVHHHVDYKGFKQRLWLRPGVVVADTPDEYGLVLTQSDTRHTGAQNLDAAVIANRDG